MADGREQHVAHVSILQREGSAIGATAQAERDGCDSDHPEQRRSVRCDIGQPGGTHGFVLHQPGQHDDGSAAEERCEVHAVGELEPLHLGEAIATPGTAECARCGQAGAGVRLAVTVTTMIVIAVTDTVGFGVIVG